MVEQEVDGERGSEKRDISTEEKGLGKDQCEPK